MPDKYLSESTTCIIITTEALFFGDLKGFSGDFHQVRDKFFVPHQDGAPQLTKLLRSIRKWNFQRQSGDKIKNNGIVVLVPEAKIPAAIVIQIIAGLKKTDIFDKVVLANGLI